MVRRTATALAALSRFEEESNSGADADHFAAIGRRKYGRPSDKSRAAGRCHAVIMYAIKSKWVE
jgi:hypothetical protein